jgi:hypothetical protein
MITTREAASALYGAYRLARVDERGMDFFDTTVEGFWRSFYAAALVAPIYLILMVSRFQSGGVEVAGFRFIAVEIIAYVTSWVAFPLVVAYIAPMIDRDNRYLGYIVAYNWASVLQNLVCLPIAILINLGAIPAGLTTFLGVGCFIVVSVYIWYVTRVALDVPGGTAAGFVVLDVVLSVIVNAYADSMV